MATRSPRTWWSRQESGYGPGTLYGSLVKLVERGLAAPLPTDDRRRPYEITAAGREALQSQLASWSRIVDAGKARLRWA